MAQSGTTAEIAALLTKLEDSIDNSAPSEQTEVGLID